MTSLRVLNNPLFLLMKVDVAEDVDPAEADVDHERVAQVSSIKYLQLF
jgi:hypothetical protein